MSEPQENLEELREEIRKKVQEYKQSSKELLEKLDELCTKRGIVVPDNTSLVTLPSKEEWLKIIKSRTASNVNAERVNNNETNGSA